MNARKSDDPRRWFNDQLESIRARRDLSEQGRIGHIGKAYSEAKKIIDAQRAQANEDWAAGLDQLTRSLFTPPTGHTPEWRQLRDQFTDASVNDAAELMNRLEIALQTGDELEARAIGCAALDKAMSAHGSPWGEQWVQVVNRWGATDPRIDEALTSLSEHQAANPTKGDLRERIFGGFPEPSELRGKNWEQHLELAEAGDRSDMTPEARRAAADEDVVFKFGYPSSIGQTAG